MAECFIIRYEIICILLNETLLKQSGKDINI